ncbi:MAG: Coenzyme F420 hydrogenase/dehydrogenase, beta subunit C-terminal domain [Clostridiales bacterium]|nr:Coenzyme F420 hydrogenase/dehydrogenase, beta subunit C-terminal domain [Clostridiales bacterium]
MAKRSCYQCEFCGDNGVADLTIGDFWGLKNFRKDMKDDEKGVSAVKVGTQKGLHLLDSIRDNLFLEEVRVCDIYDNNHSWPTAINKVRGKILKEIREDPEHVQKIMKQYNPRYNKPKNK